MTLAAAESHNNLGMHVASKQLASAAYAAAETSLPPLHAAASEGRPVTVLSDYGFGQWWSAARLRPWALTAHLEHAEHALDVEQHSTVSAVTDILRLMYRATPDFWPGYLPLLGDLGAENSDERTRLDHGEHPEWW